MSDFYEFLVSLGLRPRSAQPDGRVRRCPTEDHPRKQNGAYWLSESGRIGWAQDWATMQEPVIWRPNGSDAPSLPRIDMDAIRAQRAEITRAAVIDARRFYDTCEPLRSGHPYLEAHALNMAGCEGLRVDNVGRLVVPMYLNGQIMSVQRIAPDGTKRFWKDAPVAGTRYFIRRPGATITVLCEGLATGLAIFTAAPTVRVVVAFSAGNLEKVARTAGRGMVAVASDNDWRTICRGHKNAGATESFQPWVDRPMWCECNPGRCAAVKVARLLGVGVLLPEGMEGTDWGDWRREQMATRELRAVDADIRMAVLRAARPARRP